MSEGISEKKFRVPWLCMNHYVVAHTGAFNVVSSIFHTLIFFLKAFDNHPGHVLLIFFLSCRQQDDKRNDSECESVK